MFHKVVRQHVQVVVGFLINTLLQNLLQNLPVKRIWKSVKTWQNYGHEFAATFLWNSVFVNVNIFECQQHTHTHTNPFNGPFSGTTRVSRYQKGKQIWILLKQETVNGSGISWAICKSAPSSRQITTPAPHHSVFTGRMPFLPPNQQHQSTEGQQVSTI